MTLRGIAAALLPRAARERILLRARLAAALPPPGSVALGDLRRVEPISRGFGSERGQPIDRYYIESFLDTHRGDIRSAVLEIGGDAYTRRFGFGVSASDVLNAVPDERATIVGDLAAGTAIES